MNLPDLCWSASIEEFKKGYVETGDNYICLLCGKKVEKGIIYPGEGVLYEAKRYMRVHIKEEHGSVFDYLVQLDKRVTGLTDHQKKLLQLFYQGKSDGEVQRELGIGSASTIRNHRFVLREKERRAKIFLVLMELLKDKSRRAPGHLSPYKTITGSNAGYIACGQKTGDRYNLTPGEREQILKKYFPAGVDGPLKTIRMKEKSRLVVLEEITKRFEAGRVYTEKEVNEILKTAHEDFAVLRRYLIEYGFMDRKPDGSRYWLIGETGGMEEENMDRKKELKLQYKEMKNEGGVYQIRNTKNQKVFVTATPNFKTINGRRFMLREGKHNNRQLQKEWNEYGEDAFVFEILEVLEEKQDGYFDKAEELEKLEEKWIERLQPFGERGYNQPGTGKNKRGR